jgi:putative intracellular protease/amidase
LQGKRIAVLAADGFEKVELTIPVKALRMVGANVDIVSLSEKYAYKTFDFPWMRSALAVQTKGFG